MVLHWLTSTKQPKYRQHMNSYLFFTTLRNQYIIHGFRDVVSRHEPLEIKNLYCVFFFSILKLSNYEYYQFLKCLGRDYTFMTTLYM